PRTMCAMNRGIHQRLTLFAVLVAGLGPVALPSGALAAPVREPAVLSAGPVVAAAPTDAHIRLVLKASGLPKPVLVTYAPDASGRLFIVEQTGRIRIYQGGKLLATPFLSITSQVSKDYEQGLLGLAFHPSFKTNHKLYVNFTDVNGDTVVREYKA